MTTVVQILEEHTGDLAGLGEFIEDLVSAYGEAGGVLYISQVTHGASMVRSHLGVYADDRTAGVDGDAWLEESGIRGVSGTYPLIIRPVPSDSNGTNKKGGSHENERMPQVCQSSGRQRALHGRDVPVL